MREGVIIRGHVQVNGQLIEGDTKRGTGARPWELKPSISGFSRGFLFHRHIVFAYCWEYIRILCGDWLQWPA